MTGNVTSLGIGDGRKKIRGIKEPGDPNTTFADVVLCYCQFEELWKGVS
jgi:hypothetical protein